MVRHSEAHPEVVDVKTAAALLGVTSEQIYGGGVLATLGIPLRQIGGNWRIPKGALAAHLGLTRAELDARVAPHEAALADRAKLRARARETGCSLALLAYLDQLEARIVALEAAQRARTPPASGE